MGKYGRFVTPATESSHDVLTVCRHFEQMHSFASSPPYIETFMFVSLGMCRFT